MSAELIARRNNNIKPFYVMELTKRVRALQAAGHDVIRLNVGEPDFAPPPPVLRALERALTSDVNSYTDARGLYSLRVRIAEDYYHRRFGLNIAPERIVITMGASAALVLACAALVEPGAMVLMPDPCYPCNRHFVAAFDGEAQLVSVGPEERFQLTTQTVVANWTARTRGVLITSPSNPTGTAIGKNELRQLIGAVQQRNGFVIVDEIYQGLTYSGQTYSALGLDDNVIVVNSFSKYFNMPGWRLGWMVAPEWLVGTLDKLSQNLFTCAPTPLQHAALACFEPDTLVIYEQRKQEFKRRRDYIVPALQGLGFVVPVVPDGAFYVYADCSKFSNDSDAFSTEVLQGAGVAVAAGKDFGFTHPERYLRFSYANSFENLERAVFQLHKYLASDAVTCA